MKDSIKKLARKKLTTYLDENNHRKTPERYAILDAVYSMPRHFSIEELNDSLVANHFPVGRATLYNSMRLFIELRLVVKHKFMNGTKYEACLANENHSHQICTVCGKVTEVQLPTVVNAINDAHLHRFHKDGFSLYLYGICSSCQAKITRKRRKESNENIKSKSSLKKDKDLE